MARLRPAAGYQLALLVLSVLTVAVALESLRQFWKMAPLGAGLWLLAAGGVFFAWIWWRSRAAWLLLSLAGAAAAVLAYRRLPEVAPWLAAVRDQALDLAAQLQVGNFGTTFGSNLGLVMLAAVGIGAGWLVTTESFRRGKAFWTMVAGLLLFGTEWSWYFQPSATFFTVYTLLTLVLWVLGHAALRDARWRAEGRQVSNRPQLAPALAAVLAVTLISTVLPNDIAPINLGELGQRLQRTFPVLQQLRGGGVATFGGGFSLAATGFTPELGRLGGPVTLDNRVALEVTPLQPLTETLYLRGATFLEYTGTTWEAGDSPELTLNADGTLPAQYASDALLRDFTLEVTPTVNFGRTIFNVLEPRKIEGVSGYQADAELNLFADRSVGRNTYTLSTRLPIYSAEQIRMAGSDEPQDIERYLQLPKGVPSRVAGMARRLTSTFAHSYDKAVAIELYLRSMRYTLDTPSTPAGRDFVDYFLFDLQEGYCTYYASAMTVMLRALGIPARFVEGFALPPSAPSESDGKGHRTYQVFNSQAHAWVEAYFPGYGWVTFDPTPRADLPLIARSAPAPVQEESPSSTPTQTLPGQPVPQDNRSREPIEGLDDLELPGPAPAPAREWPWYLTPLLLLGVLILLAARTLRAQDRFQSRESRSLVQEAWEKASGLLGRFGMGRAPHQTPQEYAEQIGTAMPPLREEARLVAEDYNLARYGPGTEPVPPEVAARAKSFWQHARALLFDRYGWRIYLWRRLWRRRAYGRPRRRQ